MKTKTCGLEDNILTFDEWYELFEEEINIELAENGTDREPDFNPEIEFEKKYQEYLIFSEVMKEVETFETKQNIKDAEILKQVKEKVSPVLYQDILDCFDDFGVCTDFHITDKPIGKYQKEDCEELIGLWVNQTTNGGYTGDTFAGTISIQIGENEYFEFSYYM